MMMRQNVLIIFIASLLHLGHSKGSCREAKKCCNGKDTDCAVSNFSNNSLIMNLSNAPCYCDKGCLDMGDCCEDYKDYCGGDYVD